MGHGPPDPDIGKRCFHLRFVDEKVKETDPHGFGGHDIDVRHLGQLFGLILGDVPNPVQAPCHQFGDLGVGLGNGPLADGSDDGLPFGAFLEIVLVLLHHDLFARRDLDDLVGAGSNGCDTELFHAHLLIILVRIDHDRAGEKLERGRHRLLEVDPNLVGSELFGVFDPSHILVDLDLVLRVAHVV